jgi:ATP-dependent protease Clp ATPase subunit
MFDVPSQPNIREVLIDEEAVERRSQPILMYAKEAGAAS